MDVIDLMPDVAADRESASFLGLASLTDLFDCQAALPFLRARSSVEMLTPDCSAASW